MRFPSGDQAAPASHALLFVNLTRVFLARDAGGEGAADWVRRFRTNVPIATVSTSAATAAAARMFFLFRPTTSPAGSSLVAEDIGLAPRSRSEPSTSSLTTRANVCFSIIVASPP